MAHGSLVRSVGTPMETVYIQLVHGHKKIFGAYLVSSHSLSNKTLAAISCLVCVWFLSHIYSLPHFINYMTHLS
jgi:hypothetical protein